MRKICIQIGFGFLFAVLLLSIWGGRCVCAQGIQWKPLCEPGCDGWVVSIGINPHQPKQILLGGDLLGVGRSVNQGERWEPTFGLKSLEMGDFTFHPKNADVVWVGSMSGPYRSTDGGKTWQECRGGFPEISGGFYSAPIEKILYDPNNSKRLLAFGGNSRRYMTQPRSKYGSVWESLDSGNSWKEIAVIPSSPGFHEQGANIVGAAFAADSSKVLYAAVEFRGVMKSTDGGRTWNEHNTGLPHLNIERVVVHPAKPDTFWVCLNTCKPQDSNEAVSGSIFRSDDGGKSYREMAQGLPNRNHENPLFAANYKGFDVSRTNPDVMYVSDAAWNGCKIFRSIDGGENWESALERRGSESAEKMIDAAYFIGPAMTVIAIDPTDENIVLAGGAEYVAKTTDGGKTWIDTTSRRVEGGWRGRGYSGLCAMNFRFDPYRRDHALLLAMDAGKCWETTDGMKSWNYHGHLPTFWGGGNDATFSRDGRVYTTTGQFGSEGAVLRSENGAATDNPWAPLFGPERGLPPLHGAGVGSGIYTLPDDSAKVWAVLGNRLYHSADSGESWTRISGLRGLPEGECGWITGDPRDGRTFYLSAKTGVYVSKNGERFEDLGGPRVSGRMAMDSTGRLYLAAYRGERPGLWRYDPAQSSWSRLKDDWHLSNVAVDPQNPERIMVVANDDPYHDHVHSTGVSVSVDGGRSWSEENTGLPVPRGHAVAFDPFNPERIVCGTLGCGFFGARWPLSYQPAGTIRYEHTAEDTEFALPATDSKNILRNGSMSAKQAEGNAPDGWSDSWGEVDAFYDESVFAEGPASLRVEPKEPGKSGQAYQMIDGHVGETFRIRGQVKSEGDVKANLAVQFFDAAWTKNEFRQIKYLQGNIDWSDFDEEITVPDWAARFNVQLMVEGEGKAWADELSLVPSDGASDSSGTKPEKPGIPEAAVYKNPWTPTEGFWPEYPHAWKRFHGDFLNKIKEMKQIDVVFFGDSITQGWDADLWKEHFEPLNSLNLGIGGDRTQQILMNMRNKVRMNYRKFVID